MFSNLGFVAGYVRSYARYLSLDPETVYERFCRESGFSNSNASLTLQIRKSEQKSTKNFGSSSNWKPGEKVIIVPKVTNEEAKKIYPDGWETIKPYLRKVPDPVK